eukprot:COSAG05_NODE_965_length_6403_cov_50.682741_8_plen_43_part_00
MLQPVADAFDHILVGPVVPKLGQSVPSPISNELNETQVIPSY